jgi:hypothetical protein
MLVTADEFKRAFDGCEVVTLHHALVTLDEGPLHQGTASVIRFIARKPAD